MKRFLKIIAYIIGIPLLILNIYILFSGKTYLYKALTYNFVDIDDNDLFTQRKIPAGTGIEWPQHHDYGKKEMPGYLLQELENHKSVAFSIIKDDSLIFEKYWENYSDSSLSNSFSMAKSIVGIMIGIAVEEKKIQTLDQPIGDFLPEFKEGKKAKVTVRHLLMMSSGLDWDEAYANPLSITTEAYYGTDLHKIAVSQNVMLEPGKEFIYQSGSTELLALVLEKATGHNLSDYVSEKLWKPLHAVYTAEWSLDKEGGREKAYCCFYSNARDFARIGSLYLHDGNMFGKQIVPAAYVRESVTPSPLMDNGKPNTSYGLHWWLTNYKGSKVFYMRGILGQYVVVIPDKQIVFVRLGHKRGEKDADGQLTDLPVYIKGVLEMTGN